MAPDTPPELSAFVFHAKIDYVSITGVRPAKMPFTTGRVIAPARYRGARLTIHDPTPGDIERMASVCPAGRVVELEVAVDVRPKYRLDDEEHARVLKLFKAEYVAKGLKPRFLAGLNSGFRGAYLPTKFGYTLRPFNRRVPHASEQLLHGHRNDGVQVKVYHKGIDNKRRLPVQQHRARMEVRLGPAGLDAHKLIHVSDLSGFAYRKELMPYFQHVHGARRRTRRDLDRNRTPLLDLLLACEDGIDRRYWESVGVGAFLAGGRRERNDLLFLRHTEMNYRIGQALHRLQKGLADKKIVCGARPSNQKSPALARTYANQPESAMTYRSPSLVTSPGLDDASTLELP
ncbi:hypothetical protein, partial [uncultured Hydrogenophaga sp.]|uniref:hypothetical protein n=1 Tax=uncultured Hydrogenophaga sp. TaxID=199683 RepID=UPI00258B43A5